MNHQSIFEILDTKLSTNILSRYKVKCCEISYLCFISSLDIDIGLDIGLGHDSPGLELRILTLTLSLIKYSLLFARALPYANHQFSALFSLILCYPFLIVGYALSISYQSYPTQHPRDSVTLL